MIAATHHDDDEPDDHEDNIAYDSDGNEYGAPHIEWQHRWREVSLSPLKCAGKSSMFLLQLGAQQVQIIEWDSNKGMR